MQINSDYINRITCSTIYQIPNNKNEITDDILIRVLCLNGSHCSFIDINRCQLLTSNSFNYLSKCTNILYLDISYTNIKSIEVISTNCNIIISLNLSGLLLDNYIPLQSMITLELLNLNNSNIDTLDDLINLKCLRSLNISNTLVNDINILIDGFTRLEELSLENCNIINESITLSIIHSLDSLKSIYIANTSLMKIDKWDITLGKDIYIESLSQSEQYLYAIINNKENDIYNLLNNGLDVNIKFNNNYNHILYHLYNNKCLYRNHSTNYFNYNHIDTSILPNALHIAMLLNSTNVIKLLLQYNIDISSNVWFGPVTSNQSNETIESTNQSDSYIHNINDYIDILNSSQAHRIINHMIDDDYIGDWQYECNKIKRNLLKLIKSYHNITSNLSNTLSSNNMLLQVENDIDLPIDETTDNNDNQINLKVKPKIPFNYKRKTKQEIEIQHIIDVIPQQITWRQHPIVNKLIGSPITVSIQDLSIYLSTNNNPVIGKQLIHYKTINYLGKKNYFLYIKKDLIELRNQIDEANLINEQMKWNQLTNKEKNKIKLESIIRYPYKSIHPPDYIATTPLDDRKEMFYEWLTSYHKKNDKKEDRNVNQIVDIDEDADINDFDFDKMSIF